MNNGQKTNAGAKENTNDLRRLFFALCPDDVLRSEIAELEVSGDLAGTGRHVPVINVHITLVFLGQVDNQTIECIEQVAAETGGNSFRLILDRVGYWSKPQILWLAPSRVPRELSDLFENIQARLGKCNVPVDQRPYKPHITLARKVKKPPPKIKFDPLIWHVKQYSLMESLTTPGGGVKYQELACWQLD